MKKKSKVAKKKVKKSSLVPKKIGTLEIVVAVLSLAAGFAVGSYAFSHLLH